MCFDVVFDVFNMFCLGRIVLYTVFVDFPLLETLVKTLASKSGQN